MTRLAILVLALGAAAGCDRHARSSDKAADEVVAQQKAMTVETDTTHHKTTELEHATAAFEMRRDVRLIGLRAEHSLISPQGEMIESLSAQLPLTDDARKTIDTKVDMLARRTGEASRAIADLQTATPDDWTKRDGAADDAMKQLESARDDAWKAFKQAKRTEYRSS